MKELSQDIKDKIDKLAIQANEMIEQDDFELAYEAVMKALELIPEPVSSYTEATWLFATLGDIFFLSEDFEQSLDAFSDAVNSADGLGNPFIHLRLGQCKFELAILDDAADELIRAYMAEGFEIFENEDPKYLEFLKTRADLSEEE